jgi:hypothetical protein
MAHMRTRLTVGGMEPIAQTGMPEGMLRGFRKITQAFGAAGGLRPSDGIARLGGGLTLRPATRWTWRTVRPFCQLHSSNARTGDAGMDAELLTKLFAIGVVLMLGRVAAAEAVSTASVDNLRVSWSDGVMAEGGGRSVATSGTWDNCQPEASRSGFWGWAAPAR